MEISVKETENITIWTTGFEVTATDTLVNLGEGVFHDKSGDHSLPVSSFELERGDDLNAQINYDLYIISVKGDYIFLLERTAFDGSGVYAAYAGDDTLIHTLINVVFRPGKEGLTNVFRINKGQIKERKPNVAPTPHPRR